MWQWLACNLLYGTDWPKTCREPPTSASQGLGLKACAFMPGLELSELQTLFSSGGKKISTILSEEDKRMDFPTVSRHQDYYFFLATRRYCTR